MFSLQSFSEQEEFWEVQVPFELQTLVDPWLPFERWTLELLAFLKQKALQVLQVLWGQLASPEL